MAIRTRSRRTHGTSRVLAAAAIAAALLLLFLWWDNTSLQCTTCTAELADLPAGFDGCRITVLSDLHGARFGQDSRRLFDAVRSQAPDCIFLVGDLVDSGTEDAAAYAEQIGSGLSAVAPVYYVTGNHEWAAGDVKALKSILKEAGVTVLSNRYVELERDGDTLILAGIDDPNGMRDQKTPEQLFADLEAAEPDTFRILLAHRNNRFPTQYSRLGADLVISGHAHGGLIRLPFTDGLVGSDRTIFPSYTSGLYEENGTVLFVTRGLGNSGHTFRVFNRPEVALLILRSAD